MVNSQDIVKDILLKMLYDSSKTLNENIQHINEQSMGGAPMTPFFPLIPYVDKVENDNLIAWRKSYPKQCKYPQKAKMPPPQGNLSSEESMILGYCMYEVPSKTNPGQINLMWIPAASEITFWDISEMNKVINNKIKLRDSGDSSMYQGCTDQEIQKILTGLLPLNTVAQFNVGDSTVGSWITRKDGYEVENYSFKGFFYNDTKESYIQPKVDDTRTQWDYLVDEYGTWAQIGTAALFVALSIATGGVGGVALLAAEIAIEGTLGAIVAQREWEKGNKSGAAFELLFGLTPWLKGFKWARNVSKSQVDEIVKKMGQSKLSLNPTSDELMTFYRTLTDPQKEIFSKMLKDTSDELTEAAMKELLPKAVVEELYQIVRKNPELLKNIEWYSKVWAKEGFVNGSIILLQIAYDSFFGKSLTEQEKMELKGIFTILPERVGNENAQKLSYQIASKPENVKKLVENASTIGKKMSQELITPKQGEELNSKIKELNKRRAERILKESGIEISTNTQDSTTPQDTTQNPKTSNTMTPTMASEQGWRLNKERAKKVGGCQDEGIISMEISGRTYYKCKT